MEEKTFLTAGIMAAIAAGFLVISVRHCRAHDREDAFPFFFFSFLYILRWIWRDILAMRLLQIPGAPAGSPAHLWAVVTVSLMNIAGWMSLLYAGWRLAEKMVSRRQVFAGNFFSFLLISSFIASAGAYTASVVTETVHLCSFPQLGVLNGVFFLSRSPSDFFGNFFFALYFLAAYFLITHSELKKKEWKTVFFMLPFVHSWVLRLFGDGVPVMAERISVISAVILLACFYGLKFVPSGGRRPCWE